MYMVESRLMNSPIDEIQAVGAIATAVGVLLAVWQLRETKKQSRTEFEDQFASDYRGLSKGIPLDAFFGKSLDPEEMDKAKPAFFHYIDLSNEQVFLRQQERISDETWQSWCGGIKSNLKLPAFRLAWDEIKKMTTTFAELRKLEQSGFEDDPKNWGPNPIVFHHPETKEGEPPFAIAA